MKINKYTITTVIFIAMIFIVGITSFWINKGEILDVLKSGDFINGFNNIYSKNVAFSDEFINIWSGVQFLTDTSLLDDAEYGFIIKDSNDNLHFTASDTDVSQFANNTISLSNTLKTKETPFIYIQAPNKDLKNYTDEIVGRYNFSNKNADEFLKIISSNNVDVLDLRELIISENLERDKLFYKTDHHWTTPTAFWAYTKIVEVLNKNYGLKIDGETFYTDLDNYISTTIEDCYLGSLGRRVGMPVASLDDYTFIEPNFETNYTLYNGLISKSEPIFSGDFNDAIVKDYILESDDILANKHASYFEWDYGDLIIKNNLCNNDIKLLIIKDSYSLPVAAFLSTAVSEVHMVDLREIPPVNVNCYIDEYDFDAVIIMYNTEIFNDKMFNFTAN